MKLMSFFAFAVVLTAVIYPVQGYWTWGEGFLDELGFSDFAGSGIVHMAGAAAALAGVLVLGARKGKYGPNGEVRAIPGANMPLAALGTFILWLGWFGFNGGSQLQITTVEDANAVAAVFVNTNLAAAAGVIGAMVVSKILFGKVDLTMILNGALAGLVSITAEPLEPSPLGAAIVGFIGGAIVVFAILALDKKFKIDDPVGAISVHGVVGIWGLIAVVFSNGDASIVSQLIGIVVIFSWVFLASLLTWFVIKAIMGVRVTEEQEYEGLDKSECGMEAYPEFNNK
jgi:ammonium transporter, Amt family